MTSTEPTRFTLSIELGNDAMQDPQHVADALRYVASMVANRYSGTVRDENGNTVGQWAFEGQ